MEDVSGRGWITDLGRTAGDHRGLLDVEWVLPGGRGGYAMGNAAYVPTRRYHGLLVVAPEAPEGRRMVFSRTEEVLRTEHGDVDLTTAFFLPGNEPVQGLDVVVEFQREPSPAWLLEAAGRLIRRRILPMNAVQGVRVTYELLEGAPALLLVKPFLTDRDHHHLVQADALDPAWSLDDGGLTWQGRKDGLAVRLEHSGEIVESDGHFYRDFHYPVEEARGYDHAEDLHAPVRIGFTLEHPGQRVGMTVAVPGAPPAMVPDGRLTGAAARFVVRHPTGEPGILAGFPWFTEWARDTMISLPGLLLASGAYDLAEEVFLAWTSRLQGGLLPNRLEEVRGAERTNAADAPLHLLRALEAFHDEVPDAAGRIGRFLPAVAEILDRYAEGTDHGIRIDSDGLLTAGADGLALTWMDAIVPDGDPVTPRGGKPIDLNALYLRGLRFGIRLAGRHGRTEDVARWEAREQRMAEAMRQRFLPEGAPTLVDVVDPIEPASSVFDIRPNQLWALALTPALWPAERQVEILDRVDEELLTPWGLRTLQPDHPDHVPHYGGDQASRDRAYHQGTVWPWLIGPWVEATLAVRGATPAVHAQLGAQLQPLFNLLGATGQVPEVCSSAEPHRPGGCPTQAWSVASLQWARHLLP